MTPAAAVNLWRRLCSASSSGAPGAPVAALRCQGQPGEGWGSAAVGSNGRTGPPHGRAQAPAADSAPRQGPLAPGPSVEDETGGGRPGAYRPPGKPRARAAAGGGGEGAGRAAEGEKGIGTVRASPGRFPRRCGRRPGWLPPPGAWRSPSRLRWCRGPGAAPGPAPGGSERTGRCGGLGWGLAGCPAAPRGTGWCETPNSFQLPF